MTHKEYADSLRAIADFFENHTEIEVPYRCEELPYYNLNKENIGAVVAALGTCEKVYNAAFDGSFEVRHVFGAITFRAISQRSQMCIRKVVGRKHIERKVLPAIPEQVVEAHDEEIIDWDCGSVLGDERGRKLDAGEADDDDNLLHP